MGWFDPMDLLEDDKLMRAAEAQAWAALQAEEAAKRHAEWLALPEPIASLEAMSQADRQLEAAVASCWPPLRASNEFSSAVIDPSEWEDENASGDLWLRYFSLYCSPKGQAVRTAFAEAEVIAAMKDADIIKLVRNEEVDLEVQPGDRFSQDRGPRTRWRSFKKWYFFGKAKAENVAPRRFFLQKSAKGYGWAGSLHEQNGCSTDTIVSVRAPRAYKVLVILKKTVR